MMEILSMEMAAVQLAQWRPIIFANLSPKGQRMIAMKCARTENGSAPKRPSPSSLLLAMMETV